MGIMLNSEYPRQMERALAQSGKVRVTDFQTLKYIKPVELGDYLRWYTIPDEVAQTFKVLCKNEVMETVFSASGVRTAPLPLERGNKESYRVLHSDYCSSFVVHDDERCSSSGHLHTRAIFNLFERARTDALGGEKL